MRSLLGTFGRNAHTAFSIDAIASFSRERSKCRTVWEGSSYRQSFASHPERLSTSPVVASTEIWMMSATIVPTLPGIVTPCTGAVRDRQLILLYLISFRYRQSARWEGCPVTLELGRG